MALVHWQCTQRQYSLCQRCHLRLSVQWRLQRRQYHAQPPLQTGQLSLLVTLKPLIYPIYVYMPRILQRNHDQGLWSPTSDFDDNRQHERSPSRRAGSRPMRSNATSSTSAEHAVVRSQRIKNQTAPNVNQACYLSRGCQTTHINPMK